MMDKLAMFLSIMSEGDAQVLLQTLSGDALQKLAAHEMEKAAQVELSELRMLAISDPSAGIEKAAESWMCTYEERLANMRAIEHIAAVTGTPMEKTASVSDMPPMGDTEAMLNWLRSRGNGRVVARSVASPSQRNNGSRPERLS